MRLVDAVQREPGFPRISTGIHAGTVVEREGRLFGSAINLTARLTSRAVGDQILCSEPIVRAIEREEGVGCRAIGEQHFKNVAHPVAIFELVPAAEPRTGSAVDPVCRMQVAIDTAAAAVEHSGGVYYFCSKDCARDFSAAPELYADTAPIERSGTGANR